MKLIIALLLISSPLTAESGMAAPVPVADSVSVEKQLASLQDSLKQVRKELEKIKKENEKMKADNTANHVKLLQESYQQVAQDLKNVRDSLRIRQGELETARAELASLSDVKEQWFKQLVATAQNDWLNRSFSSIDPAVLEESLAVYERYASESQALQQCAGQLKELLEKTRTYRDASQALNVEYYPVEVNRLASWAQSSLAGESNPSRKQELADVYDKLYNYWARISMCQDLIRSIDENLKGVNSKVRWPGIVEDVIKEEEENFATLTAIHSIPWLKEQFENYRNAVLEKGTEPNEFRSRILGLTAR